MIERNKIFRQSNLTRMRYRPLVIHLGALHFQFCFEMYTILSIQALTYNKVPNTVHFDQFYRYCDGERTYNGSLEKVFVTIKINAGITSEYWKTVNYKS